MRFSTGIPAAGRCQHHVGPLAQRKLTILDALIADFKKQSLHGVHCCGFFGSGRKEGRIKVGYVLLEKVPMFDGNLVIKSVNTYRQRTFLQGLTYTSFPVWVRMVPDISIPPLSRYLAMTSLAVADHVPQGPQGRDLSSETACNANDGDGLLLTVIHCCGLKLFLFVF